MTMFEPFEPDPTVRPKPFDGVIRRAHSGDVEGAAQLALLDAGAMAGLQHARDGIPLTIALEQRTKELTEPGFGEDRMLFVAEEAGQIVGYGRVRHVPPLEEVDPPLRPPTGWYLIGMIVDPQHRRRGIGRLLTQARLDWLQGRAPEVFYFTRSTNEVSIALHEAWNFQVHSTHFFFPRTGLQAGDGTMFRLGLQH